MSLLPQRKKSAEEIAQLRETLGIPGVSPGEEPLPAESPVQETVITPTGPISPISPIATLPLPKGAKPVRSLRKSELVPLPEFPRQQPSADSKLPGHRHSDEELNEIRRREALALLSPAVPPRSQTAHPALIIPGYLCVAAAGVGYCFYDVDKRITVACVLAALLVAAVIFFARPFSRHHAGFIAVAALLVIVFGTLHYFPQIQHGS